MIAASRKTTAKKMITLATETIIFAAIGLRMISMIELYHKKDPCQAGVNVVAVYCYYSI
jgi:hypothetical protein